MPEELKGSCNCGAVKLSVSGPLRDVIGCHCGQCRKQTGLYYAATNAPDENITVEENGALKWYQSSDEAKRGFCSECGSAIFWKHRDDNFTSILAGIFDGDTGLKISEHIFVSDKGDFYDITDGIPQREN